MFQFSLVALLLSLTLTVAVFPETDYGKVKVVDLTTTKTFSVNMGFDPHKNYRMDIRTYDEALLIFKDINYEYFHIETDGPEIPKAGEGMKTFHFEVKQEDTSQCPPPTQIEFVKYIDIGKNEMKRKVKVEFVCGSVVNEL